MRTFSNVKSSPMMPRQPEVPNLIMNTLSRVGEGTLARSSVARLLSRSVARQGGAPRDPETAQPRNLRPPPPALRALPSGHLACFPQSSPVMSRPVVLIADDDEEVAALLRMYLRSLDADVLIARDGEDALAIAQTRLPDAVLLDVMMPKRSGWEVCQALKAMQRTAHIGVILITGRGDVKDRLTGLQVGADDYLVKPFDRNEVVKRVGNVLKRSSEDKDEATQAGRTMLEAMLLDRATALPTLPVVLDRVKEILIEQGEIGIVFVDIEQIEAIEAEYGWAFFDELLCNVGQIISAEAKKRFSNAIVTCHRTGGSSFYVFCETRGQDLSAENASERVAGDLRHTLTNATRQRFPNVQPEQVGFFVGSARIDYRPQIRLERPLYNGMRIAADAVRDAEQQRKKQLTRELRDIIRRKRVTTLFQPIVHRSEERRV